ncbi:hypothetical protein [uncultured Mediterranean phage uvMED]|nr:hypothetical protein [uncultured Mediterranean phage uvMED]
MGGVNIERQKEINKFNKYQKRPEKLKSARDTFERLTGRKAKPVEQAGMFQDMTDLEKNRYRALEAKDKANKKSQLG